MFSLIVTTQGSRIIEFERFLKSLKNQKDFELILVDQSEKDFVEKLFKRFNYPGEYIRTNKKISLSKARNIGLKQAKGDYFAFPDDDCWYPDNLLSVIQKKFDEFDVDGICINAYDPILNKPLLVRQAKDDVVKISEWNALKYPISIGIFTRNSTIFFDENLGVGTKWGAGEESDYILQMLAQKMKILYFRKIKVFHPFLNETDDKKLEIKTYKYGQGFGALVKKAIKRNQYAILLDFLITIIRSFGGIVYYGIKRSRKYKKYSMRIKGMINGLLYS